MELLQYWKVIQKSVWIIVLIALVGVVATAGYTVSRPTQYQSTTTLLLNPAVPSALVPYVQTQVAANLAESYTQYMRTRQFGEAVVKELPFPMSPDDVGRAISTLLQPNTLFYKITATMPTPEQAQQLASTVVSVFITANAAQQSQSSQGQSTAKADIRQKLNDKLTYLDGQIKSYEDQITALEAQPVSKDRDDQLLQLRGQLVSLQDNETNAMLALTQIPDDVATANTAILIDQALPGIPVSDQLLRNIALALAVALLIGVGIAFLRDYLDYTIHSPEFLEEVLGLAPLGAIGVVGETMVRPRGYGKRRQTGQRSEKVPSQLTGKKLVTLEHSRSPESESFRVLRTNVQFASLDKPIRSLVITSSGPGEGKSFTASNLAVVMAQAGKRVILVDADLRKPSLHRLFGLSNQAGFTNLVLSSSLRIEGAIQSVAGIENLAVITSGPLPPNPSELLNSQQAARVMEELLQSADMVIYDAPPAGVVTDPMILGARTGEVILVIGAGSTRRDMVARVKQNLSKVGVAAVWPVLNRVKARDLQGYYYYYHYYANDARPPTPNGKGPHTNGKLLTPVSPRVGHGLSPISPSQRAARPTSSDRE
jgi:non-specific protein-tyrosine kinase